MNTITHTQTKFAFANFADAELMELNQTELVETEGGSLAFVLGYIAGYAIVAGIGYLIYKWTRPDGTEETAAMATGGGGGGEGPAQNTQNHY
jgi:hypothetical protein